MNLEIWIPALGGQEMLDHTLELVVKNAKTNPKCFVIDNGSKEPLISSLATVIRNDDNLGMIGSLIQARENCKADILVFMHSDMEIYEDGWDVKVLKAFKDDPKLALLGTVGATQADSNGGRSGTVSSFRDWRSHGRKAPEGVTPVVLLDGCLQIARSDALVSMDLPDETFPSHHFYDKDLSLSVTMQSLHVGVIGIDCQHLSGQTSCRPEYQEWAQNKSGGDDAIYREAEAKYINKWRSHFPVKIRGDWHVDVGVR